MIPFFAVQKDQWHQPQNLTSRAFICGYCGKDVSSNKGYGIRGRGGSGTDLGGVYICHQCQGPTFFSPAGNQLPGQRVGQSVVGVPQDLHRLYEEARMCASGNCPTAAVLSCRKMLMNIAVEKGADEGKSFLHYVEYLSDKGYVPPGGKGWVDYIRKKGNEANHEIKLMASGDARDLIRFVEMLLRFIYEFPGMIPSADPN